MHKTLKLVHLSDLHCDGTDEWCEGFARLEEFLAHKIDSDTVIALTGDLVDSPGETNFSLLLQRLASLVENSGSTDFLGFLCVPGNHDIFPKGNRLLSPIGRAASCVKSWFSNAPTGKPKSYIEFALHLEAIGTGASSKKCSGRFLETRRRLLIDYGIATYLFDSNGAKKRMFAEGCVGQEQVVVNENELAGLAQGPLGACKKVALLHHHPISIHSGKPGLTEGLVDAANELTNKFAFFNLLSSHGVDVVLHGHKHKSTKYSIDPSALAVDGTFSVSGCGTSCATGEAVKHEIKIYRFTSLGASGQSYVAPQRESFAPSATPFTLIDDERARRRLALNGFVGTCDYTQKHLRGSSKTKELLIFATGAVSAEIAFSGIEKQDEKSSQDSVLKEVVIADTGRIYSAHSVFDSRRVAYQGSQENWTPIDLKRPRGSGPCDNEYVELEVSPASAFAADTLRIQYHQRSGFATNVAAYDDLYSRIGNSSRNTEYCSIYAQIPVMSLELCITFPEGYFPPPNSFTLRALERATSVLPAHGEQEISRLPSHSDEEAFLRNRNCLRVWQLSRTVSLYVTDPLPGLIYAVQWEVPKHSAAPMTSKAETATRYFSRTQGISKADQLKRRDIFEKIHAGLAKTLGEDVKTFIFVPTQRKGQKVLELAYASAMSFSANMPPAMLPGRGIAGTAYLQQANVYYNKHFRDSGGPMIEAVIKGLEPQAVVGLPITYPQFFLNGPHSSATRHRAFVVTVVTEDEDSKLSKHGVQAALDSLPSEPDRTGIDELFRLSSDVVAGILREHSQCWESAGASRVKSKGSASNRP